MVQEFRISVRTQPGTYPRWTEKSFVRINDELKFTLSLTRDDVEGIEDVGVKVYYKCATE